MRSPPFCSDIQVVQLAAALLDVTEFQLFRMAHAWWFGRPAPDARLEIPFHEYMFESRAPFWVRHYARHVHGLDQAGRLRREDFGLRRREAPANGVLRLLLAVGALTSIIGLLFWMAAGAAGLLDATKSCYFPPCY